MASTPNPKIESMIVKNDRISSTDEYESYVRNSASGLFQFGDSKVDVRAHDCGTGSQIKSQRCILFHFWTCVKRCWMYVPGRRFRWSSLHWRTHLPPNKLHRGYSILKITASNNLLQDRPAVACNEPVEPFGNCCSVCGGIITFDFDGVSGIFQNFR